MPIFLDAVNIQEIDKLINPLPLSVEVTTSNPLKMIEQAQELAALSSNINVIIPIHGPDGEMESLEVIHEWEISIGN